MKINYSNLFKILKKINNSIKQYDIIFKKLDSMQTLELLSEIEKNFKIKFKENEINKKNFKDLESLNKLIIKKKK